MGSRGHIHGGGSAPLGRRFVLWGVIGASSLLPLAMNPWGYNPFGPSKALLLGVCSFVVAVGLTVDHDHTHRVLAGLKRSKVAWCAAALWLMILLSTVVSISPLRSITGAYPGYAGVVTWLAVTVLALGAASLPSTYLWRYLARGVSLAVILMGAYGIAELFGGYLIALNRGAVEGHVATTLGNPSNLGVWTLLALPLSVERLRRDKSLFWRVVAGLAFGLALVMLVFSGSRGAWVGLLVSFASWLGIQFARWSKGRSRRRGTLIAAGAMLAALTTTFLSVPMLRERFGIAGLATIKWRLIAWDAAGQAALHRPFLGWGPDSFRFVYPEYWPSDIHGYAADALTVGDPHNLFLSVSASLGFLAATILLAMFVAAGVTIYSARKDRSRDELILPAIAVALAGGLGALMFHYLTLDTLPFMAILIGMISGIGSVPPDPGSPRVRAPTWVVGVLLSGLLLVMSIAGAGLVGADVLMRSGFASEDNPPWSSVKQRLHMAQVLAPWEPTFTWATGKAAVVALSQGQGDEVFSDGEQALEAAGRMMPLEPGVAYDLAYLRLIEGLAVEDTDLITDAQKVFVALSEEDPNNPVYWSASSIAAAATGDYEEALRAIQNALVLAPGNTDYNMVRTQIEARLTE